MHDSRVSGRHTIAKRFGAISRKNIFGVQQVLHAIRDAMQWTTILTGSDLGVSSLRPSQGMIVRKCDNRSDLRIESFNASEINVCESFGSKFSRFDPARQLRYRRKRNRVV